MTIYSIIVLSQQTFKTMKKIMIFNPKNYSGLLLAAAALKADYQLISSFRPSLFLESNATEIVLLNIDPKNITDFTQCHADLSLYLKNKIQAIKAFIFSPLIEKDVLNLKLDDIIYFHYLISKKLGLTDEDLYNWEFSQNSLARYYARALHAARVKSRDANLDEYESLWIEILNDLDERFHGKKVSQNYLIESYVHHYERVKEVTKQAFKKIKLDETIKFPYRHVAFAYIDNISQYLDLAQLRKLCLETYPYLCIIQYRENDQELTWFLSNKKLQVSQFFELPKSNHDYEALINFPHNKMLEHIKRVIIEITTLQPS
jgi:uncharacterized pyridoxamine 5'-phosphate oxidase family protein